ncbi:hypothetical protein HWV23_05285 [Natronomonas halophila]|uniref:DUF6684 family protein n=1 Tax=Natronomonas halophila TaxID=2747817 RepID=UPI0015B4C254|nr:DUF6684 family protein [Natronomonas halophila]QLD85158.1 hypothetical protein HWV23_05285 [Natronomonas halophila]
MSERTFDRETLLDLFVNAIPLGILLFFVVLYAVVAPFPENSVVLVVQLSIISLTALGLAILTYYSGKAISTAEKEAGESIPPGYSEADAEVAGMPGEEAGEATE